MKGESDTGKEPEAQMGKRGKKDSECGGKQGEPMDVGQRCRLRSASLQRPSTAVHWTNSPALAGRQGREMGRNLSHRVSNLMLEESPEIKQEKLVARQQALELITGLKTGTLAKGQSVRRQARVPARDRVLGVGETGSACGSQRQLKSPGGEGDQRRQRGRHSQGSDRTKPVFSGGS